LRVGNVIVGNVGRTGIGIVGGIETPGRAGIANVGIPRSGISKFNVGSCITGRDGRSGTGRIGGIEIPGNTGIGKAGTQRVAILDDLHLLAQPNRLKRVDVAIPVGSAIG
jgi:hypothetical protein